MSVQEHPEFLEAEESVLDGAPTKEAIHLIRMLIHQVLPRPSLNMNTRAVRAPFLVVRLALIQLHLVVLVGISLVTTAPEQ